MGNGGARSKVEIVTALGHSIISIRVGGYFVDIVGLIRP